MPISMLAPGVPATPGVEVPSTGGPPAPVGGINSPRQILRALRPRQWAKNALVAAAPLAGGALVDRSKSTHLLLAIVMMCAAASATYVVNDLGDRERDRVHPKKCRRPIAAGLVTPPAAIFTAAMLVTGSLAIGATLGTATFITLLAYLGMTFAYSRGLKHVPFVELGIVAAGFVLRVAVGAAATATPMTLAFVVIVGAGALFLAIGKRYSELGGMGTASSAHRPVLASYTTPGLQRLLFASSAVAVVSYIAWAVTTRFGTPAGWWLAASAGTFLVAAQRGARKVFGGLGGDPTELILGDHVLLLAGGVTALLAFVGLYV